MDPTYVLVIESEFVISNDKFQLHWIKQASCYNSLLFHLKFSPLSTTNLICCPLLGIPQSNWFSVSRYNTIFFFLLFAGYSVKFWLCESNQTKPKDEVTQASSWVSTPELNFWAQLP